MNDDIYTLIIKAKDGDVDSVFNLITKYEKLIKKFSYVNGYYDEDLNQYLKDKVFFSINKFEIKNKSSS